MQDKFFYFSSLIGYLSLSLVVYFYHAVFFKVFSQYNEGQEFIRVFTSLKCTPLLTYFTVPFLVLPSFEAHSITSHIWWESEQTRSSSPIPMITSFAHRFLKSCFKTQKIPKGEYRQLGIRKRRTPSHCEGFPRLLTANIRTEFNSCN